MTAPASVDPRPRLLAAIPGTYANLRVHAVEFSCGVTCGFVRAWVGEYLWITSMRRHDYDEIRGVSYGTQLELARVKQLIDAAYADPKTQLHALGHMKRLDVGDFDVYAEVSQRNTRTGIPFNSVRFMRQPQVVPT